MNQLTPVITTKLLVPPRRADLLSRPRLVDFLHGNIERKLIVVSAPAGYGKTSLLVDFAAQTDVPVCWYAVDAYDTDPRIFLDHLVASIQHRFPGFGRRVQAALRNIGDVRSNLYPLAAVMANEIFEITDFLIVVLDDFHHLDTSEPINDFLSLLLRYTDENFHLLVSSRTLPAIPDQTLMAARGQMIGLSVDDLRFTPEEIQALVRQNYNLEMPLDRAAELARYSDGWITGILLTGHQASWEELLKGAATWPEANGRVYEYLAEQVLDQQPPEVRRFLLETAVLEELSIERCRELLEREDAAELLDAVIRRNLFIAPVGDEAFAYHHLFRDFLRQRLRREDQQQCRALHMRAARIYAARGEWERAVAAYLQPGLYEEAAEALEQAERVLFDSGRWDTLIRWLDSLPRPVFQARPRLMSLRGRLHVERGEIEPALELYQQVWEEFHRQGDTVQEVRVLLRKATALRHRGSNTEALHCIDEAFDAVSRLKQDAECKALEGSLYDCKGSCYYSLGQPAQAIPYLQTAARLYQAADDALGAANAFHNLGISYRAIGDTAQAMDRYKQALHHWQRLGNPGWLANTLNSLGMVYYVRGEWDEAGRIYEQALEHARQAGLVRLEATILAGQGDLQRDRGHFQAALQTYDQACELAERARHSFILAYVLQARGETLRLQGCQEEAATTLAAAQAAAEKIRSDYVVGLCRLSLGALAADQGQLDEALTHLETAEALLSLGDYRHELARVQLFLAHVYWLRGQEEVALARAARVADFVQQLGYDHFLTVDGRHMQSLLRRAAAAGLGGGLFERLLQQVQCLKPEAPPSLERPVDAQARPLSFGPKESVRVYALGRGCVLRGEEELIPQREQVKALFFYLLAHHPQPVRKEELMEELWSGFSPQRADGTLRVTLYRLRRAICPVSSDKGWLALELPEGSWYDVWEFEQALRQARQAQANPDEQAAALERAIALYQGDYLEQVDSPWVMPERERLRREHQAALLSLARLRLAGGDAQWAVELYQRVLQLEPYDEEAWRGLMLAQAQAGNRAAAVEAFHRLRHLLRDDLGLDPSPETQQAYRQVLEMSF